MGDQRHVLGLHRPVEGRRESAQQRLLEAVLVLRRRIAVVHRGAGGLHRGTRLAQPFGSAMFGPQEHGRLEGQGGDGHPWDVGQPSRAVKEGMCIRGKAERVRSPGGAQGRVSLTHGFAAPVSGSSPAFHRGLVVAKVGGQTGDAGIQLHRDRIQGVRVIRDAGKFLHPVRVQPATAG